MLHDFQQLTNGNLLRTYNDHEFDLMFPTEDCVRVRLDDDGTQVVTAIAAGDLDITLRSAEDFFQEVPPRSTDD
jgi:hypothetical protein